MKLKLLQLASDLPTNLSNLLRQLYLGQHLLSTEDKIVDSELLLSLGYKLGSGRSGLYQLRDKISELTDLGYIHSQYYSNEAETGLILKVRLLDDSEIASLLAKG